MSRILECSYIVNHLFSWQGPAILEGRYRRLKGPTWDSRYLAKRVEKLSRLRCYPRDPPAESSMGGDFKSITSGVREGATTPGNALAGLSPKGRVGAGGGVDRRDAVSKPTGMYSLRPPADTTRPG